MDLSDKDVTVIILNVFKEMKDKLENFVRKLEIIKKKQILEKSITKIKKSVEEFNSLLDAVEERISDWKIAQKKIQTEA